MDKKVVVVTGASSGIGAELCRLLGAEGHSVVLAARREKELKETAAQSGKDALSVVTDVTKKADIDNLKAKAIDKFGRIDVWVNNAGQGIGQPFLKLTEDDINQMIDVNVKSVVFGSQAAAEVFLKQGSGHIINISSFLGRIPFANIRSAYCGAKAMVNNLTAILRVDLRRMNPNIKVSLVMPGMVSTEFANHALHGTPQPTPQAQQANRGSGMQIQTPQEVAAILYEVIKNPKPEVYTNPSSEGMAKAYYNDIAAFEDNMFKGNQ